MRSQGLWLYMANLKIDLPSVASLLSSRAIAKDLTFLDDRAGVVRFLARLGVTT